MEHPSTGALPLTGGVPLPPDEAAAIATVFARVGDQYVPLDDFVREVRTLMGRDEDADYRHDMEDELLAAHEDGAA